MQGLQFVEHGVGQDDFHSDLNSPAQDLPQGFAQGSQQEALHGSPQGVWVAMTFVGAAGAGVCCWMKRISLVELGGMRSCGLDSCAAAMLGSMTSAPRIRFRICRIDRVLS